MALPSAAQTDFDFMVPVRKELLTVEEVADILRFDRSTIYDMVLVGQLEMHRRPGAEKSHQRITRRSVVAYLAKSANYETEDMADTLFQLASTLTAARRRALAHRLLQS